MEDGLPVRFCRMPSFFEYMFERRGLYRNNELSAVAADGVILVEKFCHETLDLPRDPFLFSSILSYLFWNRGIRTVGATRAGVFIHLIPVFSIVHAMFFLGESLKTFHLIGSCLIFSGIYLTTRK